MNLTIPQVRALMILYPQVITTSGIDAFDKDGIQVNYDFDAVQAKAQADEQAQIDAKQTALNKLMALGLTEEEALALGK